MRENEAFSYLFELAWRRLMTHHSFIVKKNSFDTISGRNHLLVCLNREDASDEGLYVSHEKSINTWKPKESQNNLPLFQE